MRKLRYQLVDVFTGERFGGNPLAVFTNGRGLETAIMQRIAKELNLSETVFVLPPDDPANDYKMRIFTPAIELPMAGHPTIGTAFVLAREHLVAISAENPSIRLEEQVGVIPVEFAFQDDGRLLVTMEQPPPTFGPEFAERAVIAEMLSLDVSALDDLPLQVVSCGVPFLFIPVKTLDDMCAVKVRADVWEKAVKGHAEQHLFAFTRQVEREGSTVHSRMFAPAMGITEDPATGAASGPLGCYLVKHGLVSGNPAVIVSEQGIEMGRPSFIHIQIDHKDGDFKRVTVGGQSVYIGEGVIEI
jgi:trans-2,3-dihydro-3-hydroxyanthranilate isomerase